jgi:hypothetical protein
MTRSAQGTFVQEQNRRPTWRYHHDHQRRRHGRRHGQGAGLHGHRDGVQPEAQRVQTARPLAAQPPQPKPAVGVEVGEQEAIADLPPPENRM